MRRSVLCFVVTIHFVSPWSPVRRCRNCRPNQSLGSFFSQRHYEPCNRLKLPISAEKPAASSVEDTTATTPSIPSYGVGGGSLLGCTALVAGTTVGAGIIALPAKTVAAGFVPTTLILVGGWIYMAFTGLLIAEVNVNTLCTLDDRDAISIHTMTEETLGSLGARASSCAFLFLHYALITAYILQGGSLLLEATEKVLPFADNIGLHKDILGPPLFAFLLGSVLFGFSQQQQESLNNILVLGVVASFVALLCFGIPQVQPQLLGHANYGAIVDALPLMPVVYVFQTVVPTLCSLLSCDLRRIRTAILLGTAIPLTMFVTWSAVILGTVPLDATATTIDPLEALRSSGDVFGNTVLCFSLLAVATSFLGFSYGLVDFLADLFGWDTLSSSIKDDEEETSANGAAKAPREVFSENKKLVQRAVLLVLALLPPVAIAVWDPSIFFSTLDNAGVYGILVLFGILPASMAWSQRYDEDDDLVEEADDDTEVAIETVLLPGGRPSLLLVFGIAALIIGLETYEKIEAVVG